MYHLIIKEIKEFWSNIFGVFSLAILILISFLFLWIFPDSAYTTYGLAETDLYFQFMAYLLLFVVPVFAVGFLSNEYKYGTEELLRALSVNWKKLIGAKFIAAMIILIFIIFLTSVNIYVVNDLALNTQVFSFQKTVVSVFGLIGIGACYIGISLMITSFITQTTASYITSVFVCFMLYSGLNLISGLPIFEGGFDFWIDRFSLSYHSEQISRGILRLSTIIYILGLTFWSLSLAAHRLNSKEV